jgi:disulfide bond formation protein DsbB
MKQSKLWMQLMFLTALVATLGSLYFSEIRNYVPCDMCWYQRILMYPLLIIMLIGIIKEDNHVRYYARTLSGIGFLVSLSHYGMQKISVIAENMPACSGVSCTAQYINWYGFITIPFLALTAFFLIFVMSFFIKK